MDAEHMEIRAMTMPLLVGPDRHFRRVRVHQAIGKNENHVAAAGTPLGPCLELEGGEVRDEICFPHMAAGTHREEFAFAREKTRLTFAPLEAERIVEDEALI